MTAARAPRPLGGRRAGPPPPPQTASNPLPPPDAAATLHLVRENLRLLAGLAARYEAGRLDPAADPLAPPAGTPGARAFHSPREVAAYLGPELADLAQEQLRALLLTTKQTLIACVLVTQGTLDASPYRLGDAFREAVRASAAAVIFAHNHPSGDPAPSPDDVRFTAEAALAGGLLGIDVLDHVVVGRGPGGRVRHASLRELGLFTPLDAGASPRRDARRREGSGGANDP